MVKLAIGLFRRSRRRTMLCLMPVLIVGLSSWGFAQRTDFHIRVRQTAIMSLTLIKPSDPNFDSTLESYFPGLSVEDGYQQAIRPFLVIVRNDTGLPAVAYAIRWTPDYGPGWASPLSAMFVNRPLMYRSAMTYIPPEGVRLISPLYNVSPKEYAATPSFTRVYSADRFPVTNDMTSLNADVDGVVYGDGSFIGANTTHILERYLAARFAARDEALAALNLINSSTAQPLMSQQLLQMLNQEIERDGRASQSTLLAHYVRARGRSAQDLRRILNNRGVSGLQAQLQSFVNRSGSSSKSSMFDPAYKKLSDNDPRVFGTISWNPKKH